MDLVGSDMEALVMEATVWEAMGLEAMGLVLATEASGAWVTEATVSVATEDSGNALQRPTQPPPATTHRRRLDYETTDSTEVVFVNFV